MSLNTLSDNSTIAVEGAASPPRAHSSRWSQLQAIDAHLAQLELRSGDAGGGAVGGVMQKAEGQPFVLAVLDLQEVCNSEQLCFPMDFRGGSQTAGKIVKMLRGFYDEQKGAQAAEMLVYLIHNGTPALSQVSQGFFRGFNDCLNQLGDPLGVALQVSDSDVAKLKAQALIRLQGSNPACFGLVISESLKTPQKDSDYCVCPHYLFASVLAAYSNQPADEEPSTSRSVEWDNDGPMSPAVEVNEDELAGMYKAEGREVDHDLPIWKQDPPICHNLVLTGQCAHGDGCKFGHDYLLTDQDVEALAQAVKRMPCDSVKNDTRRRPCSLGSACLFGHVCPYDDRCHFARCKFIDAAHPRKNALTAGGGSLERKGHSAGGRGGAKKAGSWRKPSVE